MEVLRAAGATVSLDDLSRLSPIGHESVKVYGKYSLTLTEPIQAGAFRPLREVGDGGVDDAVDEQNLDLLLERNHVRPHDARLVRQCLVEKG